MEFKQKISEEIFFRKYALHGETTVEEVLQGVAEEIASVEKDKEKWKTVFYDIMVSGEFLPAGRILANARPLSKMKNYNNCFTIDIEDSMEGIFESLKEDALIGKVGGGVGFNASKLRPKGAYISKGGESSGVMSFLEVFDTSAKAIHTGGGRRCLPAGTSVHAKTGLKSIENIVIEDEVLTSEGYEKVSNFFDQGEQETIVIHTNNGEFECTANHKMAVFDGLFSYIWKEAKDLRNGDKLVFVGKTIEGQPTEFPKFYYEKPKHSTTTIDITIPTLDKNSAWLLGLIFGDGFVWTNENNTKGGVSIACANVYPKIIERAEKELEKFGANVYAKDGDGACTNVVSYSNQLGIFFGQFKKAKKTLIIPKFIMDGTVEIRAGFIAGVFDADGASKNRPIRVVSTVYKKFATQIKYLLLSLGIPSTEYAYDRSKDGWQTLYSINVSNAVGVRSWDRLIAPSSEKYVSGRKDKRFYQSGTNDFGWTKEMFVEEERKTKRKVWLKNSTSLKLTSLERVIGRELQLYPVDFLEITKGRMVQTYDIEVENKHEFVAEGLLTHNSAHIVVLNVDHPDIEEFILYKKGRENNALTQFNISVGISDAFIFAVENDLDWNLVFEGTVYKTIKAKELFDTMTKQAWWYNEPGVLFLDTVEAGNNAPHAFKVDRCNPCGEIVMPAYNLCCLSSINLSKLVKYPFTNVAEFDFDRFKEIIEIGVRFLDNVLDATDYPLDKIEVLSKEWRRIGLGITGLADALLKLKLAYGERESIVIVDKIAHTMAETAYNASIDLAIEKGSFPAFDENIGNAGFILKLSKETQTRIKVNGLRNIGLLTIPPAGTISLTLGNNCSSGIEPIFSLQYDRTVRQNNEDTITQTVYDDGWLEYVEYANYKDGEPLSEYVVVSHDVSITDGIKVQAAFQYWIDHSISRTINMPFETTLEDYKDIFMCAWKMGLKGTTSFHEGASMDGILTTKKTETKDGTLWDKITVLPNSTKRPESLECDIYEMTVNKQKMLVLVGLHKGSPYEVFLTANSDNLIDVERAKHGEIRKTSKGAYNLSIKGKRSTFVLENITALFDDDFAIMCRLVSLSMRHHIPLQFIIDQLNKTSRFGNFSKIMARVLKKYIKDGERVIAKEVCPDCKGELRFVEGCKSCQNCGWSKC